MLKRNSIIYNYLISYILIICLLLIILLPIYSVSFQATQETALTEITSSLHHNIAIWESDIQTVYSLHTLLNSEAFHTVKTRRSNDFTPAQYYKLRETQSLFAKLCTGLSNTSDIFILFEHNAKVISARDIYDDYSIFFNHTHKFDHYSAEEIYLALTSQPDSLWFLPQITVSNYGKGARSFLTLVTHPLENSAAICVMYDAENLRSLLGIGGNIRNSVISLYGPDGQLLFQNGDSLGENTVSIECELSPRGEKVVLSIPESYFAARVAPIRQMILQYIFVAALVGLALSIFCAYRNYAPIHHLVRSYSLSHPTISRNENELTYLNRINLQNEEEKRQLNEQLIKNRQRLYSSFLTNLLCGMVDSHNPSLADFIPDIAQPHRVAVWCNVEDDLSSPSPARAFFDHLLSLNMKVVRLSHGQYAALLSDSDYTHSLDLLRFQADTMPSVSFSEPCSDLAEIHSAFLQAQSGLSTGRTLTYVQNREPDMDLRQIADIRTLRDDIISGNSTQIHQVFDLITQSEFLNSVHSASQMFYHLRCAPVMVLCDVRFIHLSYAIPLFDNRQDIPPQFEALRDLCLELASVNAIRAETDSDYRSQLMSYINEHYIDSEMCLDSVAETLHISGKQVSRVVREMTNLSFTEYIGKLRLEKATNLLLTSSMTINEIACSCGFGTPNTFYKFFKRAYGVAPSNYRR